jgi:hypothetical protein
MKTCVGTSRQSTLEASAWRRNAHLGHGQGPAARAALPERRKSARTNAPRTARAGRVLRPVATVSGRVTEYPSASEPWSRRWLGAGAGGVGWVGRVLQPACRQQCFQLGDLLLQQSDVFLVGFTQLDASSDLPLGRGGFLLGDTTCALHLRSLLVPEPEIVVKILRQRRGTISQQAPVHYTG